jgi:hypothetical protein
MEMMATFPKISQVNCELNETVASTEGRALMDTLYECVG